MCHPFRGLHRLWKSFNVQISMSKGTNHISKALPFCCFNYPAIKKMNIKQEPTGSSNCTSTENLAVGFFKH